MITRSPAKKSAVAGVLLVFFIAALIAGIGFDLGAGAHPSFWIGDQVGAAGAVGAGSAAFAIIAARLAWAVLGRRQGGDDAGPHT
jgi:hypothetical protein